MNNKACQGIELERRMHIAFTKAGWDCCKETNSTQQFDISLYNDGEFFGCVETYMCQNPKALIRKIEKIKSIMVEMKPKVFILTDGYHFENYFDGEYVSTTTIPIKPSTYSQFKRLKLYLNLLNERASYGKESNE